MRNSKFAHTVAATGLIAICAFTLGETSSAASPLASSFASGRAVSPHENLVQKVQAWSCQEKRRDMTIEQRRFCDGYYDDYDDYDDYGPGYGYPRYGYRGYGLGVPFLSFGGGWEGHHGGSHHWRHH